jgi:thiosulfate dehydrogenase (quinone) large subunit
MKTSMTDQSSNLAKTTAAVRIATGILFLLFGEYKVADPAFAHSGFQQYLQGYIQGAALTFYRPLLAHLVLPHVVFFGYAVGLVEFLIGVSLVAGLWVRPASIVGALFLLNLLFATWWEPGHGIAIWRYFGAELDKIPLIFLFLIFYAAKAGRTWGLDGVLQRRA